MVPPVADVVPEADVADPTVPPDVPLVLAAPVDGVALVKKKSSAFALEPDDRNEGTSLPCIRHPTMVSASPLVPRCAVV